MKDKLLQEQLAYYNAPAWIKKTNSPELDFRPSFRSYATQRADLLAVLEPLPP